MWQRRKSLKGKSPVFGNQLSLDQSPPFRASLRFFMTAPLFILVGCVLFLFLKIDPFERWDIETIGILHFFNLGFLVMVVMGALTQMLPVLAGTPIPNVLWFSRITHVLITLGSIFFPLGIMTMNQFMIQWGGGLALLSIIIFFTTILWSLRKALQSFTVSCFKLSACSVLIMIGFAGRLALSWAGWLDFSVDRMGLIELHIAWALFGFLFILILGVSHKVVPMFYVTNDYPLWFTKYIAKAVFFLLLCWSLVFLAETQFLIPIIKSLLAVTVMIYASETFQRFVNRKRKVTDTTVLFWKTSMAFFALGSVFYFIIQYWPANPKMEVAASLFFGIALLSLMTGMLYKIIPFLTWFHLTARNIQKVPTMRELLPNRYTLKQYYMHLVAILFLFLSDLVPMLRPIFGVSLGLSMLLILFNLLFPLKVFRSLMRQN